MKQLVFALLFVFASTASMNALAGTKLDTRKQDRKVSSFHSIKISTGIDLVLQQSSTTEVTVEADDDLINDLITEVKNETLHIYLDRKISWGWNRTMKVFVNCPDLVKLDSSAGSDVKTEGVFKTEEFTLEVSSGSDVDFHVDASKVRINTSSGSDAKVKGTTGMLTASSSSGSDLDASELKARVVEVSASSGSDASVYASEKLNARASSGADISYYGNPTQKNIDESSGGDVSKR